MASHVIYACIYTRDRIGSLLVIVLICTAVRGPVDKYSNRRTNSLCIGVSAGVSGSGNLQLLSVSALSLAAPLLNLNII